MSYPISTRREPLTPRETVPPDQNLIHGWGQYWSNWHPVINPTKIDDNWERRTGLGYRLKPNLVSRIFDSQRTCGIYEFMATREIGRKQEVFVVYVGCSCRDKGQSLPERINEYCASGSHKAILIDEALSKGYTLSFRYKPARDKKEAEDDENRLLVKYSYGWNRRTPTGTLPD